MSGKFNRTVMAVVLAVSLSGCSGGGGGGSSLVRPPAAGAVPLETGASIDWLIEGPVTGVASRAAHDALQAAQDSISLKFADGRDARTFGTQIYAFDAAGNSGIESFQAYHLALPSESAFNEWGFWNHSNLFSDIVKVQWRSSSPHRGLLRSAVYGILDTGLFWILRGENDEGQGGYGAGYGNLVYNEIHSIYRPGVPRLAFPDFFPEPNRRLSDPVGPHGATWTGDALGVRKTNREAVHGQARLTVTGASNTIDLQYIYAMELQIDLNTGDTLTIDDLTGRRADFRSPGNHNRPFQQDRAHGKLLRGGEEVIGAFETVGYIGAFGAKRR